MWRGGVSIGPKSKPKSKPKPKPQRTGVDQPAGGLDVSGPERAAKRCPPGLVFCLEVGAVFEQRPASGHPPTGGGNVERGGVVCVGLGAVGLGLDQLSHQHLSRRRRKEERRLPELVRGLGAENGNREIGNSARNSSALTPVPRGE